MGIYINQLLNGEELPAKDKADFLLTHVVGARQIHPPPKVWEEDLVCVVENGLFDAAGYVFSQQELEDFQYSNPRSPDRRRKTWLHIPGAANLNPFGAQLRDEVAGR